MPMMGFEPNCELGVFGNLQKYIASKLHDHSKTEYCTLRLQITLQEHQKFRTNATISLISDLLKSMGGFFLEFFP